MCLWTLLANVAKCSGIYFDSVFFPCWGLESVEQLSHIKKTVYFVLMTINAIISVQLPLPINIFFKMKLLLR